MKAPFPYFGGKSRVADVVWNRLGDVKNYVEPFAGSLAVLLSRKTEPKTETVNDINGFIANFWRALKYAPDEVFEFADWPVNEIDLFARHVWLVNGMSELTERLHADHEFYDAKMAGFWVWGISAWIGGQWCDGKGKWNSDGKHVIDVRKGNTGVEKKGVNMQLQHLGNAGAGVHKRRPHLGNAGMGVHRQLPHLCNTGRGVHRSNMQNMKNMRNWAQTLSDRLRRVRVCCGDWRRVTGPSVTFKHGMTGVFLDPPYLHSVGRSTNIYVNESADVAAEVREWAIENGDNDKLRIALCGYEGEHDMPSGPGGWECYKWSTRGGMSRSDNKNRYRERIWFSPHCLKPRNNPRQVKLF